MAIPFGPYQGQDLTNWQAGNKFLPREFYSLKTTPSTTLSNQIGNTGGITGTQAAGSYMGYPSYEAWLLAQGGSGNGGGGGGPDVIEEDKFSMGMSPGAMSGGLDQAKLPGVGNWAKRTFGPLAHAYSQLPTPTNLAIRGWKGIQRWRENKKIEKEQQLQQEIIDHNKAAGEKARVATVAQQIQQNIDRGGRGDRPDTGRNAPGGGRGQSPTGGNVAGTPFAQGGRIGYRDGEFVEEDINIQGPGFDVNENIEMVEGGITDEQKAMVLDMLEKGMDLPTIISITGVEEADILGLMGGETAMAEDQGIAGLV